MCVEHAKSFSGIALNTQQKNYVLRPKEAEDQEEIMGSAKFIFSIFDLVGVLEYPNGTSLKIFFFWLNVNYIVFVDGLFVRYIHYWFTDQKPNKISHLFVFKPITYLIRYSNIPQQLNGTVCEQIVKTALDKCVTQTVQHTWQLQYIV